MGSPADGITSSEANPAHTYAAPGTYQALLTVTDDDGSTDTACHDVTITDLGPTAAFSWAPEPQDEGAAVQFTDASTSSPDGIVSWSWDFDGGATPNTSGRQELFENVVNRYVF